MDHDAHINAWLNDVIPYSRYTVPANVHANSCFEAEGDESLQDEEKRQKTVAILNEWRRSSAEGVSMDYVRRRVRHSAIHAFGRQAYSLAGEATETLLHNCRWYSAT